jgi:RimJ/RimL family protein N-acetyltransferase
MAWTGTVVLTTPRLRLRCFRDDDLDAYATLNVDPEVAEHLGGPVSRQYTEEMADWANELYDLEGIGLLAVERAEDSAFLGMCGLHHLDAFPDDIEIAWRLAREHWGNGYATEAAEAWLDYGFKVKKFSRVISVTEPTNVRSIGVMQRLGMTFDHATHIVEEGKDFDVVVYSRASTQSLASDVQP